MVYLMERVERRQTSPLLPAPLRFVLVRPRRAGSTWRSPDVSTSPGLRFCAPTSEAAGRPPD